MLKSMWSALKEFVAFIAVLEGVALALGWAKQLNEGFADYRGYSFACLSAYVVFRGIVVDAEKKSQLLDMHETFTQTLQSDPQTTKLDKE